MIGEADPGEAGFLRRHAESRESFLRQEGRIIRMSDEGIGDPKIHVRTIVAAHVRHPIIFGLGPRRAHAPMGQVRQGRVRR